MAKVSPLEHTVYFAYNGFMNLSLIAIILSHPENSQNVGAVCRAMATCGIHDLRIVGRKADYDGGKVCALALHAKDIWEKAKFFDTISSAAYDCTISIATTRRRGKKRKAFLMLPEEAAKKAAEITGACGKAAIVFGNERTGLTDDEMNECTAALTIPSSKDFASLNLSHAVQVVCYCLFMEETAGRTGYSAIDLKRLDGLTQTIGQCLKAIGFFSVSGDKGMEDTRRFWREVLSRSALSEGEAQYMEHIFNKAKGMANKRKQDSRE